MPPWDTALVTAARPGRPADRRRTGLRCAARSTVYRQGAWPRAVSSRSGTDTPLAPVGLHLHLALRALHRVRASRRPRRCARRPAERGAGLRRRAGPGHAGAGQAGGPDGRGRRSLHGLRHAGTDGVGAARRCAVRAAAAGRGVPGAHRYPCGARGVGERTGWRSAGSCGATGAATCTSDGTSRRPSDSRLNHRRTAAESSTDIRKAAPRPGSDGGSRARSRQAEQVAGRAGGVGPDGQTARRSRRRGCPGPRSPPGGGPPAPRRRPGG